MFARVDVLLIFILCFFACSCIERFMNYVFLRDCALIERAVQFYNVSVSLASLFSIPYWFVFFWCLFIYITLHSFVYAITN